MTTMKSGLLLSALLTGGVLLLVGAGVGWWLASGGGEVWIPEPAKQADYIGITVTCGLIPGLLGAVLGASVYSLVAKAKASKD